jgi:hypothetical protein
MSSFVLLVTRPARRDEVTIRAMDKSVRMLGARRCLLDCLMPRLVGQSRRLW